MKFVFLLEGKYKFKMADRWGITAYTIRWNWNETVSVLEVISSVLSLKQLNKILVNLQIYFSLTWSIFKTKNWKVDELYSI